MVPYLWVRKIRHVTAPPGEFIWDFSYFYRAAERFAADPLTLYADPDYFYPPPSVLAFLPWLAVPEHIGYQIAVVLNMALMAACGVLAVRLWERHTGPVSVGPVSVGPGSVGPGSVEPVGAPRLVGDLLAGDALLGL